MLRKAISHVYRRGQCCSVSLKTGVAVAKLQHEAHRTRHREIQPDADKDSGAIGAGLRVWGHVFFFPLGGISREKSLEK